MSRTRTATRPRSLCAWVGVTSVVLAALPAFAGEGTAQLTTVQELRESTVLRVDILDHTTETFTWTGTSLDGFGVSHDIQAVIKDPSNVEVATIDSGESFNPTSNGAWYVEPIGLDLYDDIDCCEDGDLSCCLPPASDPLYIPAYEDIHDWDITVVGAEAGKGRVWSKQWRLDADTFSIAGAFGGSFYAKVEGGAVDRDGVVELLADGLAGFSYSISADDEGVIGGNGRSRSQLEDWFLAPQFSLYLLPPEDASYDPLAPNITNVDLTSDGYCDGVALGISSSTLSFTSDVTGTYHFICDINADGVFDLTSDEDFHVLGDAVLGLNEWSWDGSDNIGAAVPPGEYECVVKLTVGEFHYVASDVETSFEGFRLFEVSAAGVRTGLDMYWNDAEVQDANTMLDGQVPLETSGPDGVFSGSYGAAAVPNVNARSWGNFTVNSKGNESFLDTYTWIDEDQSDPFTVKVYDLELDTDGDRLVDAAEDCVHQTLFDDVDTDGDGLEDGEEVLDLTTEPLLIDTDGDGLDDAFETGSVSDPFDTDGDDVIDPLDTDDDGDGRSTLDEDLDLDSDPTDDDTDGDDIPDYLDFDDDADGVPSSVEGDGDTDADGTIDPLDVDDDGDGIDTEDEDLDLDGDPTNDDGDDDGAPDYLDVDDDGDGVLTIDEDVVGNGPANDDLDGDDVPDYLDADDDGDGVLSIDEDLGGDGDPTDEDTDGDTIPNYLDADDDGDGIASIDEDLDGDGDPSNDDWDSDGTPDYLDVDDDDDGIPSVVETAADPDGDDLPSYLDDDADGDGILDVVETGEDTDGDGVGNFLDLDSDGDTLDDGLEGETDSDGDGDADFVDPDDDGDAVPTEDELQGAGAASAPDTDGDAIVDWLDTDDDGDTIPTVEEGGFTDDFDSDGTPNHLDEDADGDGILDETEGSADTDGDLGGNFLDLDADGDGYDDALEGEVDTDADGSSDFLDVDDDGDGVRSADEVDGDTDGDALTDRVDPDDDGDGISTADELADGLVYGTDVDGDLSSNWVDTDSDGDGVLDADEFELDEDADDVPDYLDPLVELTAWYAGSGLACSSTGSPPGGFGVLAAAVVALVARRRRVGGRPLAGRLGDFLPLAGRKGVRR